MAALLFLSGCNKTKQFTVTLNLDNADQKPVYLFKDVDGKDVCIDTAVFAGQQAVLKADFADPQEDALMATFMEVQNTYMAGDTVKSAELQKQLEASMEDYENYRLDYIKKHSDSYMAHFMLLQSADEFGYEKVKEAAKGFTSESVYSKRINDYIEAHAKVEVGAKFMDFTLKTAEGEEVNLETVINSNRLVLVDFWASWCGPCRGENPFVKAAYEKYHANGFEIIGVSVDQDEAAWQKAVADDGMTWIQVRDVDNTASTDYMIQFIPSNFLYDGNGVMIAKGLRGEELEAKLAEVLQ